MPRYGMPVPPGPPPSRDPESHREPHRARGPAPPMRPTQQFAVKPIIKEEDLRRMDDIDQEGSWACVRDEIDYNKKIQFSDDEEEKEGERKLAEKCEDESRSMKDANDKKSVRILERQQPSSNDRDRYESALKDQGKTDAERSEDWSRGRGASQYDSKERGNANRRGRDSRDEDWRGYFKYSKEMKLFI